MTKKKKKVNFFRPFDRTFQLEVGKSVGHQSLPTILMPFMSLNDVKINNNLTVVQKALLQLGRDIINLKVSSLVPVIKELLMLKSKCVYS